MTATTDLNGDGTVSNLAVVAHIDDDILFLNPDLIDTIRSGAAHATIYVTAGDAGRDEAYWRGREAGAKAAYAEVAGHDDWVDETRTLSDGVNSFTIATSYLASQPDLRLYFLRLPDGFSGGSGSNAYGGESLRKLWNGEISTINSVDDANNMTASQLIRVIESLIRHHGPDKLMMQDHETEFTAQDHSDHIFASIFAEAAAIASGLVDPTGYVTYGTSGLHANVADNSAILDMLRAYVAHDPAIDANGNADGVISIPALYEAWTQRQYYTDDFIFSDDDLNAQLFVQPGSWNPAREVRMLADADGDGLADMIGFADSGVRVGASVAQQTAHWVSDFGYTAGNWRIEQHVRRMGDVDGDGKDDVVGFGGSGVLVSLSSGAAFSASSVWLADYSYHRGGWRVDQHERMVGDINGDGMDDIIGFGGSGVLVSLSTGSSFTAARHWLNDFSAQQGWRTATHERRVADVNGDGRDDVIGFADDGAWVSLSTGTGLGARQKWISDFGQTAGNWRVDLHDRELADVNGDGMADIVGFGTSGVLVALSTGSGFQAAQRWTGDFGTSSGWSASNSDRMVADVNGDGLADLICVNGTETAVALSNGSRFLTVSEPEYVITLPDLGNEFVFV